MHGGRHKEAVQNGHSIAAVARDTGLSRDTLRVWERRYGFPQPARNAVGERTYSQEQLERLRTIRRLVDAGHRPGQIVGLPHEALRQLLLTPQQQSTHGKQQLSIESPADWCDHAMEHLKTHQLKALRMHLVTALSTLGLTRFIDEVAGPLTQQIGTAWIQGQLEIFQEHAYTECMCSILRNGILQLESQQTKAEENQVLRPKVLLTTLPQEAHSLGLLMAEALLASEGCECVPLGPQMPVTEIAQAARAHQADIVALSFTALPSGLTVISGLRALREALPIECALWVGGSHPVLGRHGLPGIETVQTAEDVRTTLLKWHGQHA
jgi:DNA-binding transcriptional MerR regulator